MARRPEHIVTTAARYVGVPYGLPPSPPESIDCSLYVLSVLEAAGVTSLAAVRTAEQIRQACGDVPWDQIQPGDLVFLANTYDSEEAPGPDGQLATHVAISLGVGSGRVWSAQEPAVKEVVIAGNDFWQSRLISAGRAPGVEETPLPTTVDLALGFDLCWPEVRYYADLYGADATVMAGIIQQESSWVNRLVHDDGHGRGLLGLDDRYGLIEFQQWCGSSWIGDGPDGSIAPVLQIEFLAMWLSEKTTVYGTSIEAARAWHAGEAGRDSAEGVLYESLVRDHIRSLGLG